MRIRKQPLRLLAVAGLAGLLLVSCSSDDDGDDDSADSAESSDSTTTTAGLVNEGTTIEITDFQFGDGVNPARIKAGDVVTWENASEVTRHGITHEPNLDAGEERLFESNTIQPGESFSQTFDEPGTFDYVCSIHPLEMKGAIIIEPAD
jgi:plastocyanin